ncbi:PREDICTED: F-box only protein 47-like [Amphimedon queenslandica]|uniref:FBXO47 ARM repeats region domain-containing protein n=1 Tax=Amphimedon queenslandica TaxID=400682 RepID=A0A1X7U8E9_AMPQE|nr:PREDICTED: F-box only protein 47-like [Amphimedon queenslandica]|eukprot:XP_019855717.1 PREDICTED: F-box only protein 47-like [Amphimedon queenslandica]
MLKMAASGLRSTFASWFSCPTTNTNRKRPAKEMETPDCNNEENLDPNTLQAPRCKKQRRTYSVPREIRDRVKRKLFTDPPAEEELTIHNDVPRGSRNRTNSLFVLPIEILHLIFGLLDRETLTMLASLSKDLNESVITYALSGAGLKHVIAYQNGKYEPAHYSEAGNMFRRLTATKNLRQRLKIASQISEMKKPLCDAVIRTAGNAVAYKCFGSLFFRYIITWSEYDKLRAYCFFEKKTKLCQKISHILRLSPGVLPLHESDVRQLVCSTLLGPSHNDEEYSFWLSQLLKGHPITHQARLLYMLAGPTDCAGFILWSNACDCTSPLQLNKGSTVMKKDRDLSPLARGFRVLLTLRKEWSMDSIISVFDEMTTTPSGWCLGQVAMLLMLAGTDVTQAILGNRAVNGHVSDLTVMMYYLAHSCVKEDNENGNSQKLSWYLEMVRYVTGMLPGSKERQWFAYNLIDHWQSYLMSLFEEDDISEELANFDDIRQEFVTSLNCLSKLSVILLTNLSI